MRKHSRACLAAAVLVAASGLPAHTYADGGGGDNKRLASHLPMAIMLVKWTLLRLYSPLADFSPGGMQANGPVPDIPPEHQNLEAAIDGAEPLTLDADGSFSATIELKVGANDIVVTALDLAGNVQQVSKSAPGKPPAEEASEVQEAVNRAMKDEVFRKAMQQFGSAAVRDGIANAMAAQGAIAPQPAR